MPTSPAEASPDAAAASRDTALAPRQRVYVVVDPGTGRLVALTDGVVVAAPEQPSPASLAIRATLPGLYPEHLGSHAFRQVHKARFCYVGGSMARGIASPALVVALCRAGFLAFVGSAGVDLDTLHRILPRLRADLQKASTPWGANLIHSPNAPDLEEAVVDALLGHDVRRAEASAFMDLQPSAVRYACTGLKRRPDGRVARRNFLFAKVSRPEVARHFLEPAPATLLQALVARGALKPEEAQCAQAIPVASDLTVESDSGGHTDNRPLGPLFSRIAALRDAVAVRLPHAEPTRLGAAGGLGTPWAIAGAFAMGADYVLVGSVHQATVEAGICPEAKQMLARADVADVAMTASADMFEQGVKVQVLSRGTMMATRGNELYRIYRTYPAIDAIPGAERRAIEEKLFRAPLEDVWAETRAWWLRRHPDQVRAAAEDPKLKMAMVFRSYLGRSSRWPIDGDKDRRLDYQLWCGPAMGAFNAWVKGSFLEPAGERGAAQVALNLMEGAACVTRAQQLRLLGLDIVPGELAVRPRPLSV